MPTTERHPYTVTVLTENTPVDGLAHEHGLSLLLQCSSSQILLDFGQSDAFARNADTLGINLSPIDHAVLSHAHYDHADGMGAFFERNDHAPLHLSAACAENCWSTKGGTTEAHYIGIKPGLLERYRERLSPAPTHRVTAIAPGIHLVPHTTLGLAELGKRAGMLLREGDCWLPDSFAHEQSLVLELDSGTADKPSLAVFNSCSHAGVPAILAEVGNAFPGARIAAFVGGLHLVHASDDEIRRTAEAFHAASVTHVYTGHCTGARALKLLAQELPHRVQALHPGMVISL